MIREPYLTEDGVWVGWRCIYCGEILDRVIMMNRRASLTRIRRILEPPGKPRVLEWAVK